MSKRAIIYARASLDISGEGRSVDRQTEACRALLQLRGIESIGEVHDNSISAYGEKHRPGWEKVLGMIERGEIDYVAAWHLDRMTRSMLDLEKLILLTERHGVGILTATGDIDLTTDVGRMVARILAAVARAEVERKAARQKLANRQLAAAGKPWTGGARPFGYTADQLDVIEEEAEAIRWGAAAALDGVSMGEIAREWGRRGLESSRAKHAKAPWSGRGVKAVLVSPRYVGRRSYLGTDVGEGTWPAILDDETHLALKSKLEDPLRRMGELGGGKTARNLLTQLARCSECDEPLRASAVRKRPSYSCPQGHVNPPRDKIEEEVHAAMIALLSSPDFIGTLVASDDVDLDSMRADLDALHRRSKILAASFADGNLDESTFLEVSKTLRTRIAALEGELTAATAGSSLHGLSVGTPEVEEQWLDLSLGRQRIIIEQFLSVVVVRKAKSNQPWRADLHLDLKRREAPTPA